MFTAGLNPFTPLKALVKMIRNHLNAVVVEIGMVCIVPFRVVGPLMIVQPELPSTLFQQIRHSPGARSALTGLMVTDVKRV
jgi:hypothetical protein